MPFECPGSKNIRQPQPEYIKCPFCKTEVEIWTDEIEVVCTKCKNTVKRHQEASCLDWCSYAKECVGVEKYALYDYDINDNIIVIITATQ